MFLKIKQVFNKLRKWFNVEQDFLDVKEFAAAVGVSVQAIYKRLKKDDDVLNNYVSSVSGKTMISASAINDVFNIKGYVEPQEIEQLKERIEEQKEQLKAKDDLINSLMEQIKTQTNLLNQEQQLNLLNQQKILMLEEKTSHKGIFNLFKRKNKEVEQ